MIINMNFCIAVVPEMIAGKSDSHNAKMDSIVKEQLPFKADSTINFHSQEAATNFARVYTPEVVSNQVMNNERVDVISSSEIQTPNPPVQSTFGSSRVNVKTESPNMLEDVLFYSATSINSASSESSNVYSLTGIENSSSVCQSTMHSISGSNFFDTNASQSFVSQNTNIPLSSSIASSFSVANVSQQEYAGFNVPLPEQIFINTPPQGTNDPIKPSILIGGNSGIAQPIPASHIQQTIQVQVAANPSTQNMKTISQPELQCYPQYPVGNHPLLQDQSMFDTTKCETSIHTLDAKINNDSFASSFPCPTDDFLDNTNLEVTNREVAMQVTHSPIPAIIHPVTHMVDTTKQQISHTESIQSSDQYQIVRQEQSGVVLQQPQHTITSNESHSSMMNQVTNEQIMTQTQSDFHKDKIHIDQPVIPAESLLTNTASLAATPIISAPLFQLPGSTTCATSLTTSPTMSSLFGGNDVMKMPKSAESGSDLPFEHTPPDLFAMHHLLQSIGPENLATITGEDVQEQLQ